jgi:hypothetical protein
MILMSLNKKLTILEKELGLYKNNSNNIALQQCNKCNKDDDNCECDICFRCGKTDCTADCY